MTVPAELRNVRKAFGPVVALADVSLRVDQGEVVALLGANGAGKTTAVGALLGLKRPDAGKAVLFGRDSRSPRARALVGATPQEMGFPQSLRVGEVCDLVRAHYDAPLDVEAALDLVGVADLRKRQVGGLSGGQRRRLALALAFIGAPKLVLLDEPTTGLDVESRRQAWDVVRSFRDDGGSVLLTTHYIDEAEALASRVIVIRRGMIVADDSVEAIRSRAGLARIRFRDVELPADLRDGARRESGSVTIFAADAGEAVRRLVEAKVPLHDLEVRRETLEEALGTIEGRGA